MDIHVVPALQAQRDLVALPRTMERFEAYVRTMVGPDDQILLPLFMFNPMAREHVADVLDELIGFEAEGVMRTAAAEAAERLHEGALHLHVIMVVVDDAQGGWTNRFITDFEMRFTERAGDPSWVQVLVWSSEGASPERVRSDTLRAIFPTCT